MNAGRKYNEKEVLSDSTEKDDRGEKMNLYLKVGVEEVWLVDPRVLTVERYILDDKGEYFYFMTS